MFLLRRNGHAVDTVGHGLLSYPWDCFQMISVLNHGFGSSKISNKAWVMRTWGELNTNLKAGHVYVRYEAYGFIIQHYLTLFSSIIISGTAVRACSRQCWNLRCHQVVIKMQVFESVDHLGELWTVTVPVPVRLERSHACLSSDPGSWGRMSVALKTC